MEAVKQKSAATVNRTAAQPLHVQRSAAAARVRPPSVRAAPSRPQLSSLRVSRPSDPAEKEAESTARQVVRMSIPDRAVSLVRTAAGGVFRALTGRGKEKEKEELEKLKLGPRRLQPPQVARFADTGLFRAPDEIRRKAEGTPNVSSNVAAEIQASGTGGTPLPLSVRRFMEPRFNADFSGVRVHTGDKAAKLNRQLNARAFAVGKNVFFGKGQFRPETEQGRELIAHELTHTIQQGAAVQRSHDVAVTQRGPEQVQRLGVSDVLDYFADRANLIPGFRMLTVVIGVNPVNMSRVDRSAANILRAIVEFIPGGGLITRALDSYGVFDRAGAWVEQQIRTLGMTGEAFKQALDEFLDSLSWTDIFDLGGVWNRARRIFSRPVDQLIGFVVGLGTGILRLIRDAILRPLAGLAQGTRGYDLLKAILGQDPITGDPYPRNADTLIGGFMKLIGQEEIWENIKRANAVARAWAWFQGALSGLMGIVRAVPGRFVDAVTSLTLADIVVLPRAFVKVAGVFLDVVGSFFSWAGAQVMSLLQIIFEVVAPAAVPYLRRAAGTFQSILRNPIGFVGNLVRAGMQGFRQFGARFLTHLRAALIGWLTGTMSGAAIYIPQGLTLREIVRFVLSVLGLTWQNIRVKLVRAVGETAVGAMETGFDVVRTLVTQGPAAAWEKISEGLSNLREMVMEQIMTFVRDRVVNRAIQTLVTSLNPAGAFIQAVIAIYNTIMFFVERLRQIAQVAMSFIDSISAIAGGVIATAANRVEQTMAGLLTLVISFLARLAGLGRVGDAVVGIINRVRAPIDRALDRVVDWIVAQARRLGRFVASGARAVAGALRSLTGRGATLPRVAPAVLAEVQRTPAGTVLFQGRSAAGPAQVQSILQSRPGARFDDASGVLALPPVNGDALASAPSLRAMAQQLAQQTGVTRVTLARSGQRWALDGHINPTLAGLAQHVAGNALDPLLDDIRRESDRISPQKEPLMAICRERAARHRAAVAFRVVPRSRTVAEERTYVDFSIPGASPAVTFSTYIVTTGDAVCPSCGAAAGVSRPHNVIPGRMWRDAVETGFRGFGVVKPYDNWAGFIESVGDSRADSAVSPTEDRQCDQCERNQDKQPIPHSLIQRRAVAAGYLITLRAGAPAGSTTGQAFVGQQYGEPGGPSSMNDAQVWELTRIKIDQVLEEMGNRLNMAPTGAATPRPNTSPVYTNIVAPNRIPAFLALVRRSINARATAARSAASFR